MLLGRGVRSAHHGALHLLGDFASVAFIGLLAEKLIDRYKWRAVAGLTLAAGMTCAVAVAWASFRPADAEISK